MRLAWEWGDVDEGVILGNLVMRNAARHDKPIGQPAFGRHSLDHGRDRAFFLTRDVFVADEQQTELNAPALQDCGRAGQIVQTLILHERADIADHRHVLGDVQGFRQLPVSRLRQELLGQAGVRQQGNLGAGNAAPDQFFAHPARQGEDVIGRIRADRFQTRLNRIGFGVEIFRLTRGPGDFPKPPDFVNERCALTSRSDLRRQRSQVVRGGDDEFGTQLA